MKDQQIARTIADQIGGPALYMIGAKNLRTVNQDGMSGLAFKFMRSRGLNYMQILYNEDKDLYEVSFGYLTTRGLAVKKTFDGVFCDQVHDMIEQETGLVTSFPTVRVLQ